MCRIFFKTNFKHLQFVSTSKKEFGTRMRVCVQGGVSRTTWFHSFLCLVCLLLSSFSSCIIIIWTTRSSFLTKGAKGCKKDEWVTTQSCIEATIQFSRGQKKVQWEKKPEKRRPVQLQRHKNWVGAGGAAVASDTHQPWSSRLTGPGPWWPSWTLLKPPGYCRT